MMLKKLVRRIFQGHEIESKEDIPESITSISSDGSKIEMDKSYYMYGIITNVLNDDLENFWIELNYKIKTRVNFANSTPLSDLMNTKEFILARLLEPGVFLLKFTKLELDRPMSEKGHPIEAICHAIMFPKAEAPQEVH